jgi:hypothetical protein
VELLIILGQIYVSYLAFRSILQGIEVAFVLVVALLDVDSRNYIQQLSFLIEDTDSVSPHLNDIVI